MKIEAFRELLQEFECLVASIGNTQLSRDLACLTHVMDGNENQTVAKFVDYALKVRDSEKQFELSESLSRVDEYLKSVSGLLVYLKKSPGAKDVEKLRCLLRGFEAESVESLASQVKDNLAKPPTVKKATKAPLNRDLVREYADILTAYSDNNDKFDAVLAQLKSDKKLRVEEVRAIAEECVGYSIGKKSRKVALQSIIDRQSLIARHEAKDKSFGGLRSW